MWNPDIPLPSIKQCERYQAGARVLESHARERLLCRGSVARVLAEHCYPGK